jgi:rhomboid-related protein 1/2/3
VWRYISYSLVHLNKKHITTNILLQLVVGVFMEMRHGTGRVVILYLLGVIASSLAYYCFDELSLSGSSGGVYCLVASCICTTIFNWREDKAVFINRYRRGKSPLAVGGKLIRLLKLLIIVAFTSLDFGWQLYLRINDENKQVSVVAHFWGALTGVLMGFTVLTNEVEKRWEKGIMICCQGVFILLFSAAVVINILGCNAFVNTLGKIFTREE